MARVGCARRVCFDPGLHDHHCRSGEAPCCICDSRCRGIKCVDRNLLAERRAAELAVGIASQIRTTRSNGLAGSVLSIGLSVGREPLIFAVRRMTAFTLVRSGVFGAAAVAAPAAVLFLASGLAWSSDLSGLVAYAAVLAIALAVVAALAWACVRFAELGPTTAVILTTMPFIALTVVTLSISLAVAPHLGLAAVIPVLFWAVQLAVAVLVARAATRRALL